MHCYLYINIWWFFGVCLTLSPNQQSASLKLAVLAFNIPYKNPVFASFTMGTLFYQLAINDSKKEELVSKSWQMVFLFTKLTNFSLQKFLVYGSSLMQCTILVNSFKSCPLSHNLITLFNSCTEVNLICSNKLQLAATHGA